MSIIIMRRGFGSILLITLVLAGVVATSIGGYFWWMTKNSRAVVKNVEVKPAAKNDSKQIATKKGCQPGITFENPSNKSLINYISEECNFSFSYPNGWYLYEWEDYPSIRVGDLVNPASADPETVKGHTLVDISKHEGKMDPSGVAFSINGYKGAKSSEDSMFGPQEIVVLPVAENEWFEFILTSKNYGAFNQILSTFKFIDQKNLQGVACGGWDTSGQIICGCSSGQMTKTSCPIGTTCDSGTYYCQGTCGACCYKGVGVNSKYSPCD